MSNGPYKTNAEVRAEKAWVSITNADLDKAALDAGPGGAVVAGPRGLRIVRDASKLRPKAEA